MTSLPVKFSGHIPFIILEVMTALSNFIRLGTESQLHLHPSFNPELSISVCALDCRFDYVGDYGYVEA